MPKVPNKIARTYSLPIALVERMEKVYAKRDRSLSAFVVNAIIERVLETEMGTFPGEGETISWSDHSPEGLKDLQGILKRKIACLKEQEKRLEAVAEADI